MLETTTHGVSGTTTRSSGLIGPQDELDVAVRLALRGAGSGRAEKAGDREEGDGCDSHLHGVQASYCSASAARAPDRALIIP